MCVYGERGGEQAVIILLLSTGPVAVKKLNVSNPTEQQMQAFKNEVGCPNVRVHTHVYM